MATPDSTVVPASVRGPLAVAGAVVVAALLLGTALPAVDSLYVALAWLGAFFGLVLGPFLGGATVPLFQATSVGYGPPELTPGFATAFVPEAWRYHVGAATFYAALAGAAGSFASAVGSASGVWGQHPLAGAAVGGLAVGAAFLGSQVWRTYALTGTVDPLTTAVQAVYGALLGVPPVFALVAFGLLWGGPGG